jgi:hypothetical protein
VDWFGLMKAVRAPTLDFNPGRTRAHVTHSAHRLVNGIEDRRGIKGRKKKTY